MSIVPRRIALSLALAFLLTAFIGTHVALPIDVNNPDGILMIHDEPTFGELIHYLAKRRFLPTRRDVFPYIDDDISVEDDKNDSHLFKRYFLKSKRYFLNS